MSLNLSLSPSLELELEIWRLAHLLQNGVTGRESLTCAEVNPIGRVKLGD